MKVKTKTIKGQESWLFGSNRVEAALTVRGGQLAPVKFKLGGKWVQPFGVAPWAEEKLPADTPQILRALRGDFFCMPFGGNGAPYLGEQHPPHGDTANGRWRLAALAPGHLHAVLDTQTRRGRVDKRLWLRPGQTAVYSQHVISGMTGKMSFGHHPVLQVPDDATARVSVSPIRCGQVFPGQFENAAVGGYSILRRGAQFTTLNRVPRADGGWADLSVYPEAGRNGYEDLAFMAAKPDLPFAWTALTVTEHGYVWFSLKDPQVLPSTVFWMSNGGRHYAPWSSRHRQVIGLEEVLANFDYGLAQSVHRNAWNGHGVATCTTLSATRPLAVNFIMAVAKIPAGFDIVSSIKAAKDHQSVTLTAKSGKSVKVAVSVDFLQAKPGEIK